MAASERIDSSFFMDSVEYHIHILQEIMLPVRTKIIFGIRVVAGRMMRPI